MVCFGQDSHKIQEALEGGVVYLAGERGSTFVAARGEPTVFTDQPTKLWFPEGGTDPSLCFVRLKITSGEYWTTSGMQAIPYVLEAVSAYFNGQRPVVAEPERHGKIGL